MSEGDVDSSSFHTWNVDVWPCFPARVFAAIYHGQRLSQLKCVYRVRPSYDFLKSAEKTRATRSVCELRQCCVERTVGDFLVNL